MRISATTLESFRLFMQPEQDWMQEQELIDTINGIWKPNHKVSLGQAFGRVLEEPDRYAAANGYRISANGETFEFANKVMQPCLSLVDRRGIFEAKAIKSYGDSDVVSKADHLLGAKLSEFKTTLSSFNADKYMDSCQWRFMADAFQPVSITYHVFCLSEATNGVIELKSIETMTLYPYAKLHEDCAALVRQFADYVTARGLDGVLRQRQRDAA